MMSVPAEVEGENDSVQTVNRKMRWQVWPAISDTRLEERVEGVVACQQVPVLLSLKSAANSNHLPGLELFKLPSASGQIPLGTK